MTLFDRETETDALRAAIESVRQGRGGVTVIEAPPGFGKTSLCDHAAELAAERGVEVLAARGTELQEPIPFGLAIAAWRRSSNSPSPPSSGC